MAELQTQIESQVIELAAEAFKTFCDDIAGMFGVGMQCDQKEVLSETVEGLKKRFRKLVAVNVVHSEGSLNGTFQLVFDQEGLFTLGGVIVMLPEQRILANRKDPSPELAASMVDAVGEAGNLLVGSWDRVFREQLKGHGHFLQKLPAFIGRPWDEPKEKIGVAADEELVYVAYEMTIGSYPAFNCGVIFPKTLFTASSDLPQDQNIPSPTEGAGDSQNAQAVPQAQDEEQEAEQKPVSAELTAVQNAVSEEQNTETVSGDASSEEAESEQADTAEQHEAGKSKSKRRTAAKAARKKADVASAVSETDITETTETETAEPVAPAASATSEKVEDPATGEISQAIRRMTESAASLPGESGQSIAAAPQPADLASHAVTGPEPTDVPSQPAKPECVAFHGSASNGLLSMPAMSVMKSPVVWATPEETVQQALARMQQHDIGYLMIGQDGVLEGMVSRSDIAGALSPYLRSIFAKWRRPLDDATLKIKVKWIMSRPVRTIRPDTPLATVMENMCRFGGRAVPVMDEQGKVQGIVTVFDVFQKLLKTCEGVSTAGKSPQSSPLN